MNKPNIKRLGHLADFLDQLPEGTFNFGEWVTKPERVGSGDRVTIACGTTACAIGWAPSVPALRKAGLRMRIRNDPEPYAQFFCGDVTYAGGPLEMAQIFFDLTVRQASRLFLPDDCSSNHLPRTATAKQVAAHIRTFIKEND